MKLNNKGFAITGILYGLLILFALLVGSYLTVLTARKNRLDGIVENIENEYNGNTTDTYKLTLEKDDGVSKIYYKINEASSYISTTSSSITLDVQAGTTYYYYGTASSGYTMNSCTSSSPCSEVMETSAVTKSLTATANNYSLIITKGTGVSTIYYKINGASSYSSSTSNKTLSVQYGTRYYYYGTASSGYTMNTCTSSSPCSGTMGMGTITKQLTATATASGSFVVSLYVDGDSNGSTTVSSGSKYEQSFMSPTSRMTCSCTNSQPCSISHSTGNYYIITINSVTANTTCNVDY